MRVTIRQAAVALLASAAACSQPKPAMQAPTPDRYTYSGDVERFGEQAILSIDEMARYVVLDVRRPARLFMYAVDLDYHLHTIAQCWVEPGRLRVQPTLATNNLHMNVQGFGTQGEQWHYGANNAVLVIMIEEVPRETKRACDHSGDGGYVATMPPSDALQRYALSLRRYPDSPWASYLVEP